MATINVARITFTANDPIYGGFVAGDIVDVYWDTVTLQFSVQKNGSNYPQAGSSRIHTSQREVRPGAFYYRTTTMLVPEICVGTTLHSFSWEATEATTSGGQGDWPYVFATPTENSNQCAASPVIQDLAWTGLPSVTHCTSPISNDGSITYNAASSYGPVKYTLGETFSYSTSTFNNLAPGKYIIKAKDALGFVIAFSFEIIDMTSGRRPPPLLICDLKFTGTPSALSQDTGSGNGSITFAATSSQPILYALRDFYYSDETGQASSTFSNLRAGTYRLHAVDSKNCKAWYDFTIPLNTAPSPSPATPPANGIEYQMGMTDFNGKQSIVNIVRQAFDGTTTQIDGGTEDPIVYSVRLEGSTDIFAAIVASQLEVQLKSEYPSQFESLFQNSELYRVYYYKEGVLKFAGKIYPQTYKEPWSEYSDYPVTLLATDGLVELDDVDFLDDNGNRLTGNLKQIEVVAYALSKLGFELNIRSACNIYDTGMNQTAADDPLDQTYVDCLTYYPKNKVLSCMEVIRRVLEPYNASIVQWEGYWWIVRFEELVNNSVAYREFNKAGAYVSNGTFDPLVDIRSTDSPDRVHWLDGAFMDKTPAYGNVEVTYQQGLRKSLIRNGEFNVVDKYTPDKGTERTIDVSGFTVANNGDMVNTGFAWVDYEKLNAAMVLQGTGLAYVMAKVPAFKIAGTDRIHIQVRYRIEDLVIKFRYQKVKFMVQHGSKYLLSDGTWSSTPTILTAYQKDGGEFATFKISSTAPPSTTGIATEDLTIKVYSSYVLDAEFASTYGGSGLNSKLTAGLPAGYRTEVYVPANSTMFYYELENTTQSAPGIFPIDIVTPTDYNSSTNPYKWVLKESIKRYTNQPVVGQIQIDEVSLRYSPGGAELVEEQVLSATPKTTKNKFERTLYHGSAVQSVKTVFNTGFSWSQGLGTLIEGTASNQNAKLTHVGFVRNASGVSWDHWKRDAVAEDFSLQQVALRSLTAQFKEPSRRITGSLSNKPIGGGTPKYITPITVLRDRYDNTFYKPMGFSYHDRLCEYSGEVIEMVDITAGGTATDGGVSSFSSAFNSAFSS